MSDENFYEGFRSRIQKWAGTKEGKGSRFVEHILVLPDFMYLVAALILDPAVKAGQKAKLGMALAYVISPLDLLPEALLGPAGYADDVALVAFAINQLLNHVDEEVVLKHWKGQGKILEQIRHIVEVADNMVGSKIWNKLKVMITNKS